MLDTLPDFLGFIKILAVSMVFLITGAVVTLSIIDRFIGNRFCDICQKEINDEVNKYHDKIKEREK